MPVKLFSANASDAATLEAKINEWMAKLEPGSARQVSSASGPGGQVVVTVWYTESKDRN